MVGSFLFFLSCFRIENTDGITEYPIQILLDTFGITFFKSFPECHQALCVTEDGFLKPFVDLKSEDFAHFPIRNNQAISAILRSSSLCQVPSRKKYAPKVLDALIDLFIREFQAKLLFDGFPVDQTFDLTLRCFIRFIDKAIHEVVSARIDPVRFRPCLSIILRAVHKVYNIPRTVHICISEVIAVVPLLHFCKTIFHLIIRK